jgi:hypothetical protein
LKEIANQQRFSKPDVERSGYPSLGKPQVVGARGDEPDRAGRGLEQLEAVGVLFGEDLDDRGLDACRAAADLAAQSNIVVELEQGSPPL